MEPGTNLGGQGQGVGGGGGLKGVPGKEFGLELGVGKDDFAFKIQEGVLSIFLRDSEDCEATTGVAIKVGSVSGKEYAFGASLIESGFELEELFN